MTFVRFGSFASDRHVRFSPKADIGYEHTPAYHSSAFSSTGTV
jgi:hypothetical protein